MAEWYMDALMERVMLYASGLFRSSCFLVVVGVADGNEALLLLSFNELMQDKTVCIYIQALWDTILPQWHIHMYVRYLVFVNFNLEGWEVSCQVECGRTRLFRKLQHPTHTVTCMRISSVRLGALQE